MNQSRQSEKDKLLILLQHYFDLEELRTMCFTLNLDYENIRGDTKEGKCRELILRLGREDRLAELLDYAREKRPTVKWPDANAITFGGYLTSNADEEVVALERYRRQVARNKVATVSEGFTFRKGNRLNLDGKTYVVREVLLQQNFGPVIVSSARVSDVTLNRNVGICRVETLEETTQARVLLNQVKRRAQIYSQIVPPAKYLPQLFDLVEKPTTAVWLIMEWLDGRSLEAHLPQDGPLPDKGKLALLLGWTADICEAIAALHKRRQSPILIDHHTIVLPHPPRGAFLIDPVFSEKPQRTSVEFPEFDPIRDLKQLAAVLFQVATHKPAQNRSASDFNPAVPQKLNETIQEALSGDIKNAHSMKRALLQIKHGL